MVAEEPGAFSGGRLSVANRRILTTSVSVQGEGVRSGRQIRVTLEPVEEGHGVSLTRSDTGETWPMDLSAAIPLNGCSALGSAESHVAYLEHLMAALASLGITDCQVRVDGPELPLLDGSARPWLELLEAAAPQGGTTPVLPLILTEPIVVHDQEACLLALPAPEPHFTYILDHPHPLVGVQWAQFRPGHDDFATELAPARTFTTIQEARYAQEQGLLRGGSEANALVIYEDHFSEEPELPQACARHKLLDLFGDLYLLERPVQARIVAYQSGHRHNHQLAKVIQEQESTLD